MSEAQVDSQGVAEWVLVDFGTVFAVSWFGTMGDGTASAEDVRRKVGLWLADLSRLGSMIVCFDTPPYSRQEMYEGYKSGRDKPAGFDECKKACEADVRAQYMHAEHQGAEADDVIASLLKNIDRRQPVRIVSRDKDLVALVDASRGVYFHNCGNGELYRTDEEVVAKFGVRPVEIHAFLSLAGDQADSIPGGKGIGPKAARELIGAYGHQLSDILSACDRGDESVSPRVRELVNASRAQIAASGALVSLLENLGITAKLPEPKPKGSSKATEAKAMDERIGTVTELTFAAIKVKRNPNLNVHQRMLACMEEVETIEKGGWNEQKRYAFAGHEALTLALRKAYVRHGIVRTCSVKSHRLFGEKSEHMECVVAVRWTNVDDPEDYVEVDIPAIAPDTSSASNPNKRPTAEQVGICVSYAQKTAEFKAFGVVGDETPDAEDHEDENFQKRRDEKRRSRA